MFTRSEVIVLTNKHTNRRRYKHSTLFATLRRWVIKMFCGVMRRVTKHSILCVF